MASSTQVARWLRRFAEATVTQLQGAGLSLTQDEYKAEVEEADFEGQYAALPRMQPGGPRPYVFVDYCLERPYPTLWYGVGTSNETKHRRLLELAKSKWSVIREWASDEEKATQAGVAHPYDEHYDRDYYFGKYEWSEPDYAATPSPRTVERATRFLTMIAAFSWKKGTTKVRTQVEKTVAQRQGQPEFRLRLLGTYGGRCCITGSQTVPLLEAAHVATIKGKDDHSVSNGLLLRADIHTLFDLSLIAVSPTTMTVSLHPEVRASEYAKYAGKKIHLPSDVSREVLRGALAGRWKKFAAAGGTRRSE